VPLTPNDRRRQGVTLVELLVSLTLFGLLATVVLRLVRDQQRFQVGALEIIDTKRSARQAIDLLYGALRPASSADIYGASDSSISFRSTIAGSHLCAVDSARTLLTLPHAANDDDSGLSTVLAMPRAGDSLLVFDPAERQDGDDDTWAAHVLTSDPARGTCPMRPAGLAARTTSGLAIFVAPPLTLSVGVGAPVRFFRPSAYSLYRSSTGEWMLGYSTCAAGICTPRQPLSGPYSPAASDGARGIAFEYFDVHGAATSNASRIARADVVARARSTSLLEAGHLRGQRYHDSLAISIAIRNRL
jgi:prepilin-type N-terminal cleavage/methylation domain-containing protein